MLTNRIWAVLVYSALTALLGLELAPADAHAQDTTTSAAPSDETRSSPRAAGDLAAAGDPAEPMAQAEDASATPPPTSSAEPGPRESSATEPSPSGATEPLAATAAGPDEAADATPAPTPDDEFGLRASIELGFLAVLAHELQLGLDGTRLDYPTDFNQSNLFLFTRVSADFDIWRQHILTFVYQPIDIETRSSVPREVRIDGLVFPQGTPVRARYGFPFYRFGWAFDVLEGRNEELAFGLGLQIRNATIEFQSTDGELYRTRTDVGPVPLLRARGRFALTPSWFFAFDVDGFYAFIPGLNGSDNTVEGAILDASVRIGWRFLPHVDAFLNVRYIGGGAAGQGDVTATSDGFQRNWLHFLAISLGTTFDTRP